MTLIPLLLAFACKTSLFTGADVRSANITRGTIVNPEPIQCFTGGIEETLGEPHDMFGENSAGIRVWTCNHLTSSRDHQMKRCFNETDPSVYIRNRFAFSDGWRLMTESGFTWVLYRPFRHVPETHHEMEWRVRSEFEMPWITPYFFLRQTFRPYSLTYWQTGLKRRFPVSGTFSLTPYAHLDWGDDNLFEFKYGTSHGKIKDGVSAIDAGLRADWSISRHLSLWMQADAYAIINKKARSANDTRGSVTSRNGIAVFSTGLELRF